MKIFLGCPYCGKTDFSPTVGEDGPKFICLYCDGDSYTDEMIAVPEEDDTSEEVEGNH